jgi:hypothetical protein
MARTIWKFPLRGTFHQIVEMPEDAKIISVAEQGELICLWAEVDPNAQCRTKRGIAIYGTGRTIPDDPGTFIGTVMLRGGALVYHIYEIPERWW